MLTITAFFTNFCGTLMPNKQLFKLFSAENIIKLELTSLWPLLITA